MQPHSTTIIAKVIEILGNIHKTVWMLDNNQRGHPLKYQRFDISNNFVKATGRTSRKYTECNTDVGEEKYKHCILNYVDQEISKPIDFLNFELKIINLDSSDDLHRYMIRDTSHCAPPTKVDITSGRVNNHIKVHSIAITIKEMTIPLLTGYNKTTKKYKTWRNQQTAYVTVD